jgi:hypothetical protein
MYRRLEGQRVDDPPQLSHDQTKPNNDQAANSGRRAGADEGISEAEFVDRYPKSDHDEPRKKGKDTDAK